MRDNISPEEKLLRLIRNPKKPEASAQKTVAVHSAGSVIPAQSADKVSRKNKFDYASFFSAKRMVYLFLALAAIFALVSFIYPFIGYNKLLPETSASADTDKLAIQGKPKARPYEEYLKGLDSREIFDSSSLSGSSPAASAAASQELIKDINLVGIISGDNPQAIIEDKKTQKTYYLYQGQYLGEFQIEEIKEGKVKVNYRGQKFELYL